jgi:hypothetical protein
MTSASSYREGLVLPGARHPDLVEGTIRPERQLGRPSTECVPCCLPERQGSHPRPRMVMAAEELIERAPWCKAKVGPETDLLRASAAGVRTNPGVAAVPVRAAAVRPRRSTSHTSRYGSPSTRRTRSERSSACQSITYRTRRSGSTTARGALPWPPVLTHRPQTRNTWPSPSCLRRRARCPSTR